MSNQISTKRKVIGLCLHIIPGAFNAWLFLISPHWGWAFCVGFILYELDEDWHLRDHAYLDIIGWLVGFALFAILSFILAVSLSRMGI